jgi:hypothetical protein
MCPSGFPRCPRAEISYIAKSAASAKNTFAGLPPDNVAQIHMEGTFIMPYSVALPRGASSLWKILDNRGTVVFAGFYRQCEEWLDLADMRASSGGGLRDQAGSYIRLYSVKNRIIGRNRLLGVVGGL